ncbi:MAG: rRNA pseudouridine synthase [Phycisphaerales bacterium]|nr:rRNA pseudouridine synthase [Phycisphaerales bacterium]
MPPRATDAGSDPLRDASRPGADRLQRVLADLGVASRRHCEDLIREGRVEVNGELVTDLPAWVTPEDEIRIGGRVVARPEVKPTSKKRGKEPARLVYVMLHKPRDTVTTASDPEGRRTAVDLVRHPSGARLFPVGRLDFDSQGLLLMTNDGELANRLTHPRYGVKKTYRALVKGRPTEEALRDLEKGVYLAYRKEGRTVGAERAAPVSLRVISSDRDRSVVEITLAEGRNRQVRRMLAQVGCPVKRLVRVAMGPLSLRGLAIGQWRELTRDEVRLIRAAASGKLAGADPKRPSRVLSTPGPGRVMAPPKAAPRPRRAPAADGGEASRPQPASSARPSRRAPGSERPAKAEGARKKTAKRGRGGQRER